MDDFRKKVGERIVAARERKGWSAAHLAKQAGISPSTMSRWESGGSAQEGEGLAAIADLCEVSVDYLLNRSPHPNPYPANWWVLDEEWVRAVESGEWDPKMHGPAGSFAIPREMRIVSSVEHAAITHRLQPILDKLKKKRGHTR